MAFKKVGGPRKFFKYNDCTEGDLLVDNGEFLGTEQGKYGVQHVFRELSGDEIVLNSAGHLNYQVEKYLDIGTRCNITYAGKITLQNGPMAGKESHQFSMEVDDGDRPSVAATPAAEAPAPTKMAVKAAPPKAAATKAPQKKMKPVAQVSEDDISL